MRKVYDTNEHMVFKNEFVLDEKEHKNIWLHLAERPGRKYAFIVKTDEGVIKEEYYMGFSQCADAYTDASGEVVCPLSKASCKYYCVGELYNKWEYMVHVIRHFIQNPSDPMCDGMTIEGAAFLCSMYARSIAHFPVDWCSNENVSN